MDYNKFRRWVGWAMGLFFLFFIEKSVNLYGLLVVASGYLIRVWAAGYIHKNAEVTKAGPYKLLRHPLYLGNFMVGLGFTVFLSLWQMVVIYAITFSIVYYKKMKQEERFLEDKFGAEYREYRKTTPFIFPNPAKLLMKDNVKFCWNNVLHNREYLNILGSVGVMLFFLVYQNTIQGGVKHILVNHVAKVFF